MKLFQYADSYLKESTWKDLTLIKFCLAAMGILIGMQVPKEYKKPVVFGAICVFAVTYVPLMKKFFNVIVKDHQE